MVSTILWKENLKTVGTEVCICINILDVITITWENDICCKCIKPHTVNMFLTCHRIIL